MEAERGREGLGQRVGGGRERGWSTVLTSTPSSVLHERVVKGDTELPLRYPLCSRLFPERVVKGATELVAL